MKKYDHDILGRLLDIYERRGCYKKDDAEIRAITLEIPKAYSGYRDAYDHKTYEEVNLAIESLVRLGFISAERSARGSYHKIRLIPERAAEEYRYLNRKPVSDQFEEIKAVLDTAGSGEFPLMDAFIADLREKVGEGKKLPYGIELDAERLRGILYTLSAVLKVNEETYIRNFSNALFKDSKLFAKEYRSTIQGILYNYTDLAVEKDRILEIYNLYENPTYVLLKGNALIKAGESVISLSDFCGGISIPESGLAGIEEVRIRSGRVITVENLTTYHDCPDKGDLYIYLGGFHNRSKETLLKLIYRMNPDREYFHQGDLDVYGFAILESLKKRTGIPFEALLMDPDTLKKYYEAGLYKPLTDADRKAMRAPELARYSEVFAFMEEHNCKVEQESLKAVGLLSLLFDPVFKF